MAGDKATDVTGRAHAGMAGSTSSSTAGEPVPLIGADGSDGGATNTNVGAHISAAVQADARSTAKASSSGRSITSTAGEPCTHSSWRSITSTAGEPGTHIGATVQVDARYTTKVSGSGRSIPGTAGEPDMHDGAAVQAERVGM